MKEKEFVIRIVHLNCDDNRVDICAVEEALLDKFDTTQVVIEIKQTKNKEF